MPWLPGEGESHQVWVGTRTGRFSASNPAPNNSPRATQITPQLFAKTEVELKPMAQPSGRIFENSFNFSDRPSDQMKIAQEMLRAGLVTPEDVKDHLLNLKVEKTRSNDAADALGYSMSRQAQSYAGLDAQVDQQVLSVDPSDQSVIAKAQSAVIRGTRGGTPHPASLVWEVPAGKRWEIYDVDLVSDKTMWVELRRAPSLGGALCSINLTAHQSVRRRFATPLVLTAGDILTLMMYNPNPTAASIAFKVMVNEKPA